MMETISNIIIGDDLFRIIDGYMCHVDYREDGKGSAIVISMSFLGDEAKEMFSKIKEIYKK